ncbi:hypothetical protein CF319_g4639 [Tilletia indica]|nr:hypothetical protein CF319_g4639 [Tilletia indica]
MEYFARLLGNRRSAGEASSSSSSSTSSTATPTTPARSAFLRAVAGIGDPADTSTARKRGLSSSGASRKRGNAHHDLASGFMADWEQVKTTLTTPDQRALHYGITRSDVPDLLDRMADALIAESSSLHLASAASTTTMPQETTDIPPCMEYLLRSSLLDILVQLSLPNKPKGSLAQAIRFFTQLIIALDESFVSRQAVHRPLARLIRGCVGDEDGDDLERLRGLGLDLPGEDDDDDDDDDDVDDDDHTTGGEGDQDGPPRRRRTRSRYGRINSIEAASFEQDLVDLMAHIAARIKSTPELLLIFFHDRRKSRESGSAGPSTPTPSAAQSQSITSPSSAASPFLTFLGPDAKPDFPLFSYLLRFIHREGNIGELARAGLLNLITVALASEPFAMPVENPPSKSRPRTRTRTRTASTNSNGGGGASARRALAAFILNSDFAEVLGAGLGAVYGLLPTKLVLLRPQPASQTGEQTNSVPDAADAAAAAASSMLGSEGMRLGASSSTPLLIPDLDQIEPHFLLDDGAIMASASAATSSPIPNNNAANGSTGLMLTDRLRSAGMATSNDVEVQAQVRLLVLLLDFAQDVLGNAAEAIYRDSIILSSQAPHTQAQMMEESIASALTLAIVRAVRSIFLQNVVYPSMLECSDADGSATAVMAYLDVMLSVIDDRSVLADVVVGYLVGAAEDELASSASAGHGHMHRDVSISDSLQEDEEDEPDNVIRLEGGGGSRSSSSNRAGPKANRRRSTALRLVQEDSRAASNNRWGGVVDGDGDLAFAYNASGDAFGRYTLKDLILSHLEESSISSSGSSKRKKRKVSAQARQAAFRLLRTVLVEHGRFVLGSSLLVGCVREEGATAFPFPELSVLAPVQSSQAVGGADDSTGEKNGRGLGAVGAQEEPQYWPDEAPVLGLRKLDDDDTFGGGWGGLADESQPWSDGMGQAQSNGMNNKPNGSTTSHPASNKVVSAAGHGKANGGGSLRLATVSLESHLHELGLYSYLVGTLRAIDDHRQSDGNASKKKKALSGIQAASYERYLEDAADLLALESTYLYGLEAGRSSEAASALPQSPFHHRLVPRSDPLLRTLVHALSRFFAHSPESNLLLTGTLAALARCPYRSLEGWLCPRLSRTEVGGSPGEGEGDEMLEEQVKSVGSFLSWSPAWITSSISGRVAKDDGDCPVILHVLIGLAAQVRRYARSIPEFGTYLRERREGLMFVENLNDALGLGGIGVEDEDGTLGFGDDSISISSESSTPTASASVHRTGSGGAKSAGTGVVPPSQVPSVLVSARQQTGAVEEDQAGLPAVLYYKTTPPEDAGRPGTTTLPSSQPTTTTNSKAKKKAAANARGLKRGNGLEEPVSPRGDGNGGVMVQPFARHYAETGAIFVGTAAVKLPVEWRTKAEVAAAAAAGGGEEEGIGGVGGAGRRIRFEDDDDDDEDDDDEEDESDSEDDDEEDGDATQSSTIPSASSSLRPTSTLIRSITPPGATKGVLKKKRSETEFVTLSALLDNVVILEQAVMELLAVVQVRRCAGVDAVAVGLGRD